MAAQNIQFRRDTAAVWTSVNPVLLEAELGVELDTGKFKIGDGATAWTALAYQVSDGGTTGLELLAAETDEAALTALGFTTLARALIADAAAVDMRGRIGAQETTALLNDFLTMQGNLVNGEFIKFNGTNLIGEALAGGGDLLSTNNLSDVASAATALANLGGLAAAGGDLTGGGLVGLTELAGTFVVTPAAMAANAIDVTEQRNTKTLPDSDVELTFSAATVDGQRWGVELIGAANPRTITIPSTFDKQAQVTRTSFLMPANRKVSIDWIDEGGVASAWGLPGAVDNTNAAADPVGTDDASKGYAVGSFFFNTTASPRRIFICKDPAVGAAVWSRVPDAVFAAGAAGLVPAAGGTPDATKFLTETGAFAVPAGGGSYRNTDYTSASAHTGTLVKTAVWTKEIPANTLLANKRMTVQVRFSRSGTATAYTVDVELGGQSLAAGVSVGGAQTSIEFTTRAKTNATQSTGATDASNRDVYTSGAGAASSTTVDCTAAQNLVVSITLGDTGTSVVPAEIDIEIN